MFPHLILADEVILKTSFVNVRETDNGIEMSPAALQESIVLRVIGNADYSDDSRLMFSALFIPEKSDLAQGTAVFHIQTNSVRYKEVLKNQRTVKCEFVILAISADGLNTVVLAKDYFIAENRPCENDDFTELLPEDMISKEELKILLAEKSPLKHEHPEYAQKSHSHTMEDIKDFSVTGGTEYSAGEGIEISPEGVISCTVEPGSGIEGDFVTQDEFDTAIGDINSILDAINGEVI